jgi:hypothetical protein
MAKDIPVTLDLPEELLLALGRAARRCGRRPSDHLRLLLQSVLETAGPAPARRDEAVRLALAAAADWPDLQRRLRALGCVLRPGPGGGLKLCSWPRERPILPLTAFGASREALVLRFGSDFPPCGAPAIRRPASVPPAFRTRRVA